MEELLQTFKEQAEQSASKVCATTISVRQTKCNLSLCTICCPRVGCRKRMKWWSVSFTSFLLCVRFSDSLPAGEAPQCHSGLPGCRRAERSAAAFSAAAAGHVDGECRSRLRAGGDSDSAANTGQFAKETKTEMKYTVKHAIVCILCHCELYFSHWTYLTLIAPPQLCHHFAYTVMFVCIFIYRNFE